MGMVNVMKDCFNIISYWISIEKLYDLLSSPVTIILIILIWHYRCIIIHIGTIKKTEYYR